MYEGWTALLIVFLTHPGILVPIPAPGAWAWVRGLWQASWVMVLHSFSEGTSNILASMVYWMILLVWAYVYVAISLAKANA
jgi:hypothetical protein